MKMQLLLSLQLQKHDRLPVEWDKYLKVGSESIKKKTKQQCKKSLHFILVAVWCTTAIFRLQESLLVDEKAQELVSRRISISPGNQG